MVHTGYIVAQSLLAAGEAFSLLVFSYKFYVEKLKGKRTSRLTHLFNRIGFAVAVVQLSTIVDDMGVYGLFPQPYLQLMSGIGGVLIYCAIACYLYLVTKALTSMTQLSSTHENPHVTRFKVVMFAIIATILTSVVVCSFLLIDRNTSVVSGVNLCIFGACTTLLYFFFLRQSFTLLNKMTTQLRLISSWTPQPVSASVSLANLSLLLLS